MVQRGGSVVVCAVLILSELVLVLSGLELTVPPSTLTECPTQTSTPDATWITVAKQTTAAYWSNNWNDINPGNPTAVPYAGWSTLEDHRGADGYFYFKLEWPDLTPLIWKQTNNPTLEPQSPSTYVPIEVVLPPNNYWYYGLGRTSYKGKALMASHSPSTLNWQSTPVGTFQYYQDTRNRKGIPAYTSIVYSSVTLSVLSCTSGRRDENNQCVEYGKAIQTCPNINQLTNWTLTPSYTETVDHKCPQSYVISRLWSVSACNETVESLQTITVTDTTAPYFSPYLTDFEAECALPPPDTSITAAQDACSVTTIVYEDHYSTINNGYQTVQRVWNATDECGNTALHTQTITVKDTEVPVLTIPETTILAACGAVPVDYSVTSPQVPYPSISDNCGTPNITYSDTVQHTPQDCVKTTIQRTWTVVDAFGNKVTASQLILVEDLDEPVITVPPDATAGGCPGSWDPAVTGVATASDNCNNVNLTYVDTKNSTLITRTWIAFDGCYQSTAVQLIHITPDIEAPSFTVPESVMEWCNHVDIYPQSIADNCDVSYVDISKVDSPLVYSSSCSDDYSFQETWTLTDKSDNSNIKTIDISVQVTTSLSWSTVPENLEIRCDDDFSLNSTGFANAIDQCSKVVPVTWNDSSTLRCLSQSYYIIRTFSAERCGISISHQQVFTVLPPIEPISPSPEPTCSCVYGVCTTGTECVACIPGYYGSVCSSPCTCQNGICNDGLNGDGLCFSCHDGYYGRDCDMVCTCQNGTCDASTGLCLYCQPGYYGLNCKSKCNCANCEDGIHGTGNCLNSPSSNNNNNNPGASQTENTKAYLGGIIAVLVVVSVLIALLLVGVICFFQFKQRKLIVVKELLKQQERDDSVPLV